MLFNKKKSLLESESKNEVYDIVLEDYSFYFINKKSNNFLCAKTEKEFYHGLISTRLTYFKQKGFIESLCSNFAVLKVCTKKEVKNFLRNCNTIINSKKKQLKHAAFEQ